MVEPPPEPGQLLPIEKHHEVGQQRIAVYAARADLAHQVHTDAVPAQREEGALPEAQDPGIAPDQIQAQREKGITEIFAQKRHKIIRQRGSGARWDPKIEGRDRYGEDQTAPEKTGPETGTPRFLAQSDLRLGGSALQGEKSARPPLDEQNDRHQHDDFPEDRAGERLKKFVDDAERKGSDQGPYKIADPAEHDDQKAVDNIDRAEIGADIADLAQRDAGHSGDPGAEPKGQRIDAGAANAHHRGYGTVLSDSAHVQPETRAVEDQRQHTEHNETEDDDREAVPSDCETADRVKPAGHPCRVRYFSIG